MKRRDAEMQRIAAGHVFLPLRLGLSVLLLSAVSLLANETGLSPEEELKTFKVEPPLRVELVASEPQVESPCAMAFDDKGRLFVAENRGYPRTDDPPQGRIVMLESTKHDGHYDKSTVFAEGLTYPNGVLPWNGGLIVTCAPDVYFLKDTKGTGHADEKRVLLTGFEYAKSTQLRVNCPTLRPDGWIYFAAGLVGGTITSPEHPEKSAVKMTGDLRWNPKTGDIETLDGRSQYGISFDALGRRFICMNRLPVQEVVIESRWLRRNPHLSFAETVQDCNERTVKTGLRGGGDGVRVWPISHNITTADSHVGSFTAACSVRIWPSGGKLPALYDGCAFSCEPTGNLVHVDKLVPHGATFLGQSLLEKREVFASSDDWCRPVFITQGPDGALYICDMYRRIIEHPDYLPAEIRKHSDFEAGKKMGRIWRITSAEPKEARPSSIITKLTLEQEDVDKAPIEQLLASAESTNARLRFRAALGLGSSQDPRALAALTHVALAGADDKWTRAAVLSGVGGREREFAAELFKQIKTEKPGVVDLLGDLGVTFGRAALADKRDALAGDAISLDEGMPAPLRVAFLAGVVDGANARIDDKAPASISAAVADSAMITQQHDATPESRTRAIGLLKHADWKVAGPALMSVAMSKEPLELRTVAIRAAASFNETDVTNDLLAAKHWAVTPPTEREMTLAALLALPAHVPRVLDAIESGALPKNALSAAQRTALSKSKDATVRDRVAKLLGAPADGDRMKAYEAEKEVVMTLTPNPKHGGEIFKNVCSTCHRLNQEGNQVGPDLLDIRSQPKESILLHIVVPDFEIAPGFAASNIELKDGNLKLGIIIGENSESVTARQPGGVEENILRSNITSITASEHSLMPPGLEAAMSKQDMADLLSFLKGEN
ncbi:MAG TPA: PVC-type heme-binding CxxCH protein [Chthoniobacter sp.]|nr:PVC-type heme-binding CxxCH protein [Chthoniobacter sp.]